MTMSELPTNQLTDSLIEYPCEFPLKIFGQQQAGFAQAVMEVACKHDPTSREQLDALYQELCDHPMVVMVL